jgi:hypothetical protein
MSRAIQHGFGPDGLCETVVRDAWQPAEIQVVSQKEARRFED